jgi:transposase
VTNPPTIAIVEPKASRCQGDVPIARQLEALFNTIPEDDLLKALKVYYAGRCGYTYKVLWRTYIAMSVLNLPSFAALIRTLENNPYIAQACGISNSNAIPSKFAYSRFIHKLSNPKYVVMVKDVMRSLTRSLYDTLPDFGKSVAIDSTDLKAWSNGAKKPVADPDASWSVKLDTAGKKKFYFGYRLHLIVDTEHELPIAANLDTASKNDVSIASNVLRQARFTYGKFHPDYVIADAGYSSEKLRRLIKRQYRAEPIIKVNPSHKKALFPETKEWQSLYNRRTSIERLFGRLKGYRRLNNITVRRRRKVTVHSLIPVIVMQAAALAFPEKPRNCVK